MPLIEQCPFCELNTGGAHEIGCPNYRIVSYTLKETSHEEPTDADFMAAHIAALETENRGLHIEAREQVALIHDEQARVTALEARLSKMDGLEIQISDGDVWLHFPDAAISIEGICNPHAPGPIVQRRLREWRDKTLTRGDDG